MINEWKDYPSEEEVSDVWDNDDDEVPKIVKQMIFGEDLDD